MGFLKFVYIIRVYVYYIIFYISNLFRMSTGYSIQGSHAADFLSANVSETLTIGNTGLATTIRIYDCNAPLNGYLLTSSNGVFTINDASDSLPTRVGIGSTNPLPNATLQVAGTLLTSNIGTYATNTNNTLFFNNTNLANISNISVSGQTNTIGTGQTTLVLGNNTGAQSLILSDINTAQWKITTAGNNLNFYNDNPTGGVFTTSRFHINQNGNVGTNNNTFDDGSGNATVAGTLGVTGTSTFTGAVAANGGLTTTTLTASGNSTITGTLNAQNLICGSNSSALTVATNKLSVNMNSKTYSVFTCSTTTNIQTVTVTNDIMGGQAVVYITAGAAISIYGNNNPLGGTGVKSSYTTVSLANGAKAILLIASDGNTKYVSCAAYV